MISDGDVRQDLGPIRLWMFERKGVQNTPSRRLMKCKRKTNGDLHARAKGPQLSVRGVCELEVTLLMMMRVERGEGSGDQEKDRDYNSKRIRLLNGAYRGERNRSVAGIV